MRFYTQQHKSYCGVDLHARSIYVCILNQEGAVLVHKNLRGKPDAFLAVIAPFREDLVVAVECMFTWYWIADLCARECLTFVLGHALYMKAIHGGKAKNDRIVAPLRLVDPLGHLPRTHRAGPPRAKRSPRADAQDLER